MDRKVIYLHVGKVWYVMEPDEKYGWWTENAPPLVYTYGTHAKLDKTEAQVQIALGLLPSMYYNTRSREDEPIDLELMDIWVEK